jgi:hypothetical protein
MWRRVYLVWTDVPKNIPEDDILHSHHCENIMSYNLIAEDETNVTNVIHTNNAFKLE